MLASDNGSPDVPDFDAIADEALAATDNILQRIARKIINHEQGNSDYNEEMIELDTLVAQSYLAAQIAGAVSIFQPTKRPTPRTQILTLANPPAAPDWFNVARDRRARFPWIAEAARWLETKGVATNNELRDAADEAEAATRVRWDSIKSVADLKTQLADSIVAGDSLAEFKSRIGRAINDVRPRLETGFRTATHQAYIHGATNTLEKPIITQIFPAVEYMSTEDTRVRDTHRHLDGIVAEVGSEAYNVMRRALADYGCRCTVSPIQKKNLPKFPVPSNVGELPADVLAKYAV